MAAIVLYVEERQHHSVEKSLEDDGTLLQKEVGEIYGNGELC